MENFGDRIDYWDVFNEITVDHLYHNAVSRWITMKREELTLYGIRQRLVTGDQSSCQSPL